jgi:cell division protein FtsQ
MRLALLGVVVLAALAFGGWMWLRDSSLVAVSQVMITGERGADAGAIRSALRSAARNMTTLDVQIGQLRTAVAPFPEVRRLRVRTVFPHRMVIEVIEQRPVGILEVDGRAVPVAADGTILRSVAASSSLPAIPLSVLPAGRHVHERPAADAVALLAAAPDQLLGGISQVTTVQGHGLVAQLRNGPSLYFGNAVRLSAKWLAVTEVLGDPGSAGAGYIDVSDPARPAAGAGTSSTAASPATASSQTATSASSQTGTSASSQTAATGSAGTAGATSGAGAGPSSSSSGG